MLDVAYRSISGTVHTYEDRVLVNQKRGLFAVADGVSISSRGSGGVAAQLALKILAVCFLGNVASAITEVHETMLKQKKSDRTIGETTLTVASVKGEYLNVGNVGDSPALLIREGKIEFLASEDRSPLGQITQVIGYPEAIVVHAVVTRIKVGDVVLIASDGVKHVLKQPNISRIMQEPKADSVAELVIHEAVIQKSEYDDDKTVIVLKVQKPL